MQLDETKLNAAFNKDPDSVKSLFTDDKNGIAKKLSDTLDQLAGPKHSLLTARADALSKTIDSNNDRIQQMSDRLDKQRQSLLDAIQCLGNDRGRIAVEPHGASVTANSFADFELDAGHWNVVEIVGRLRQRLDGRIGMFTR